MAWRLLSLYRVDDVPWPLRPLFALHGYGVDALLIAVLGALRLLVRVEWDDAAVAGGSARILCAWHENVIAYFIARPRLAEQVWINHPAWYMRPVHVMLRSLGVRRIILGSSGFGGREAADQLVAALLDGASTAMFPDGPHGPARELKRGALHLAAQSGLPVVPLCFRSSSELRLPGRDHKRIPLPFGTLRVSCGEPVSVDAADLEGAARALEAALGVSPRPPPQL